METKAIPARKAEAVRQFSVFTPNRLGRLHDLIKLMNSNAAHVLALTILDTTDSAIIRFVVADPDKARNLLEKGGFPFTEADVLVVEVESAMQLSEVMSALLEAEVNINYLYVFIPQLHGKTLLALSMEDNEIAEQVLRRHQFRVLKQTDISR